MLGKRRSISAVSSASPGLFNKEKGRGNGPQEGFVFLRLPIFEACFQQKESSPPLLLSYTGTAPKWRSPMAAHTSSAHVTLGRLAGSGNSFSLPKLRQI